jgi:hypothetical protein
MTSPQVGRGGGAAKPVTRQVNLRSPTGSQLSLRVLAVFSTPQAASIIIIITEIKPLPWNTLRPAPSEHARVNALVDYAGNPIIVRELKKIYPGQDGQPPKVRIGALLLDVIDAAPMQPLQSDKAHSLTTGSAC